MPGTWRYTSLLRPLSGATLPDGLEWALVATPWDFRGERPDLPRSAYRHGEFTTTRALTLDELVRFSIIEIPSIGG